MPPDPLHLRCNEHLHKHDFNPFIPEFSIVISSTTSRELRQQFADDDLKWVKNKRKLPCIGNHYHGNFHSKTPSCRKINLFPGI